LLGEELSRTGENAIVVGLPATWRGIYFLRNGFPACIAMNSRASADRVLLKDQATDHPADTRLFIWNRTTDRLEEQLR
jgi:hypothetical protein